MRVLFTDGDWRLVTSLGPKSPVLDIQHHCRQRISLAVNEWWYYCAGKVCGVCEKPIPDAMMGLKSLQEWHR